MAGQLLCQPHEGVAKISGGLNCLKFNSGRLLKVMVSGVLGQVIQGSTSAPG